MRHKCKHLVATRRQSLSLDASRPPWMQVDMDIAVAMDFDPEILSGFREALESDTPPSPPQLAVVSSAEEKPAAQRERNNKDVDTPMSPATTTRTTGGMPELSGIVRARITAFQEKIEQGMRSKVRDPKASPLSPPPPGDDRKAVVYVTSLRGVRKTFVDCCAVRSILRGYALRLDERDVSMHAGFKAELAGLLGPAAAPRSRACSSTGGTWAARRTCSTCTRRASSGARWKGARPRPHPRASSGTWRRARRAATYVSSRATRAAAAARSLWRTRT
jgi:hypothetical protein